jgi:hypothetical protein
MNSQPEDEMTPELRDALAALPREREPSRMLEERTVRGLRAAGLLESQHAAPRQIRFHRAWMAGAAAACLALFTGGAAVGHWMTLRTTQQAIAVVQAENSRQAALMVQQTGSAYVTALAQLQRVSSDANPAQRQQAREVAVQALRSAATELVRIAPDDPVASHILAGFERAEDGRRVPADSTRKTEVVWY